MIQDFGVWSAGRAYTNSFSDLSDTVLAIEACFYLERLLNTPPSKEPLLSALGGLPFSLAVHVQNELDILRDNNIKPVFVFGGLQPGKAHDPFLDAATVAKANDQAWDLYSQHDAERAVDTFGSSGYAVPERYCSLLKSILHNAGVDFQVAPYSALGQLAYLAKHGSDYIDAVAGSSELLLLDIDSVITSLNFDTQEFTFIKRQHCLEELGSIPSDMFVDACMLSGCSLLPTLPPLMIGARARGTKVRQAIELMRANGHTGFSVCTSFQDDPAVKKSNYLDRYKRSRLALKHQVVLTSTGKVEPFERDTLPNDLHEVIGQRLPDELYYYLSIGAISSSLLNKLTLGQISELCPPDGGESETYRQLVSTRLNPLRALSLSLVASHLFRSYQHRNVTLVCWFAPDRSSELSLMEVASSRPTVDSWVVPHDILQSSPKLQQEEVSLKSAVLALADPVFATKTKTGRSKGQAPLDRANEIKVNTLWRFLHLREYITADHTLSPWGKVLSAVLSKLPEGGSDRALEDAALLATELIRHELLTSDTMFPSYTGQPLRGSDVDKKNCLILSRIACLLRLRHKNIGFTGPLSRHLLGYGSVVTALRAALHDVVEAAFASILLSGDASKDQKDLAHIGLTLPLLLPTDVGLGIAMKHYLDDLLATDEPTSEANRTETKEKAPQSWFPHAEDFKGDLEVCFALWDAIYAGIKVAVDEKLIKDGEQWDGVDKWAQERR